MFVHCGSGNRVGGALLPFLMLDQGLEEEDAVGQAMRVGLRSAELLEWGPDMPGGILHPDLEHPVDGSRRNAEGA